jgi:hypothetical protein
VAYLNGSKVLTTGSEFSYNGSVFQVGTGAATRIVDAVGASNSVSYRLRNWDAIGCDSGSGLTIGGLTGSQWTSTQFFASGSEQMRLTSTGLGIGTSSPGGRLSVKAPTGNGIVEVVTGSTTADSIRLSAGGSVTNWLEYRGYLGHVWFDNVGERMRLDSSGNLGLGVTPSAWGSAAKALQVGSRSGVFNYNNSNTYLAHNVYVSTSPADTYIANDYATLYRQNSGVHSWYTAPSGTAGDPISFTQAMTLDASGRLLVGLTSSSYGSSGRGSIEINGSSQALLGLLAGGVQKGYFYNDGTDSILANQANGYLRFDTNNTERARITSGGDFLIGLTSSTAKFHVTNGASPASRLIVGAGGGAAGTLYSTLAAGDYVSFETNATERARITSGGDLLVGTSTATSSGVKPLKINNATNPGIVTAYADTEKAYHYMPSATIWRGETVTGVAIEFSAGNSNGVSLASGGTSWTSLSDERKKDIIEPITDAANKISRLRAVIGKYKTDEEGIRRAFLIAQDVQKVLPEAVNATDPNSLGIQYTETIPLLVSAIQELKSELDTVKAELATLKGK